MGKLIIIDGPSCVGKTTLAQALQEQCLPQVWLHFSIDTLVYGLPPSLLKACNLQNNWTAVDVNALMHGALACVESLLKAGHCVIFDVVISSARRAEELQRYFAAHPVFYVGLTADWDCLERRAIARKDRTLAEVKHGFETAPKHLPYDLYLDMTHQSPEQAARRVRELLP